MVNEKHRPSQPFIHMQNAILWYMRATCKRLQVGVLITTPDYKHVLGIGYNGTAKGFDHDTCTDEPGNCGCAHAEDNALSGMFLGALVPDKVLFTTAAPCQRCAVLIINSGFSKVFYHEDYRNQTGLQFLKKASIELEHI